MLFAALHCARKAIGVEFPENIRYQYLFDAVRKSMQRSYGVLPAGWIGRNINWVTASCQDFSLDSQSCSMSFAGQCLISDAVKVDFVFCLILNLAACHLTLLWCAADEGDSTFSWRCLRLLGWILLGWILKLCAKTRLSFSKIINGLSHNKVAEACSL